MAGFSRTLFLGKVFHLSTALSKPLTRNARCICSSAALLQDENASKPGWLTNLLRVRTLEPSKESHSSQLSSKEIVYEIQFHAVKPEAMESYLQEFSKFQALMQNKGSGAKLVGSFTVEIGNQDEAIHIWEYDGGYPMLNEANKIYRTDKEFIDYRKHRNHMLRSRKNQILLAFSFWPKPMPREPSNIYELRSYTLKPGTMIEWGNNWARGIKSRQQNEAPVAGFFSHLGEQYNVHHLWGYKDLQTRKETREAAWGRPGWDECVAYTVPLIRHMQSRILIPTPFSPLQ
ncbi:hypothetical protein SNE40_003020 [Patella caerulea]|uniref:NIPSNAP domain-containing protein n=1 Tax=Patella caerulea TaxID=87958 RepID=A0AAN8K9Q2_PATCE